MKEEEIFQVLTEYLNRVGDEVQGRSVDDLPEEVARLLKSFAMGGLPEKNRREVADLLKHHPAWVSELAREAKALRPGSDGKRD